MKKILIFFVFVSNLALAQTFNNYNFNTPNSDQLVDILEYETGYLLTGYITDSASSVAYDFYGAPVLLKLTKSGNPIDTIIIADFGYTELAQASIYKDGYFYVFGTTNPQNDSINLVVTKMDTSFNIIERKLYPQIKGGYFVSVLKTSNETDSTIYCIGTFFDFSIYMFRSFVYKYNFNTMEIEKSVYLANGLLIYNLLVSESEDKYVATVSSSSFFSRALSYDSSFNLISDDTLYSTNYPGFTIQSVVNIKEYKDSLYLVLGSEPLSYPINNPYYSIRVMILQVLDSNFQVQDYKYWYHDSLTDIAMSTENAIISNLDKEYFLGATVHNNLHYPSDGLLIVKIDSALNTIWQKHIECTAAAMRLINMHLTDDGGVLILYEEQVSITGADLKNSKLMKIGPNGEVTSIIDLGKQISKQAVNIFPNPATKEINLILKQPNQQIAHLSIIDIQGKIVLQKQINDKQAKLDVSSLCKGVYIVEGYTSKGKGFNGKFVRE